MRLELDQKSGKAVLTLDSKHLPFKGKLADSVYGYLFHRIVSGEIEQGTMLPSEDEFASFFNVSRPVVRDALEQLRRHGLVVSRRGRGSVVSSPKDAVSTIVEKGDKTKELLFNMEFRIAVEPSAAALAAERHTEETLFEIKEVLEKFEKASLDSKTVGYLDFKFHLFVAKASDNNRFIDAITSVEYDIDKGVYLMRHLAQMKQRQWGGVVLAEHLRIYEAIEKRNANSARIAMQDHLERARMRMIME